VRGYCPLTWNARRAELFRAELLRILLSRNLITEQVVTNLLPWRHGGFSAHGAVRTEDRQGAMRLGRYMIRCPIVLKRPSWERDTGEGVCRSRPARLPTRWISLQKRRKPQGFQFPNRETGSRAPAIRASAAHREARDLP
jgi:hypothetical protein